MFKSEILNELSYKGFINNCSGIQELDDQIYSGKKLTLYLGADLTAKSFHIGHMVPLLLMRIFQKYGHKPIILLGGATTKIGDPSFRNTMRPILTNEAINENLNSMKKVLTRFLDFDESIVSIQEHENSDHQLTDIQNYNKNNNCPKIHNKQLNVRNHFIEYDKSNFNNKALLVNNDDWLSRLGYIEILQKVGKSFSINRMVNFDMVKSKLENNISFSFLEFNYMIMQGYDFLELYEKYNCTIQIGGQDQWGNILCGAELVHKHCGAQVLALTTNLLLNKDGSKMGKTSNGAVWLDKELFSEYDFWQYFRNTPDENVEMLLKIMTDLDQQTIDGLSKLEGSEKNKAKIILADEVTKLIHSTECLEKIHNASNVFSSGSLDELSKEKGFIYCINENTDNFIGTKNIVDILIENSLQSSRSEAKKLIRGGGVKINDQIIDETFLLNTLQLQTLHKLQIGKKNIYVIQIVS